MVFPPIDSEINKQKQFISAHLTCRNQITHALNEQGFKVSTASVTNIINRYSVKVPAEKLGWTKVGIISRIIVIVEWYC